MTIKAGICVAYDWEFLRLSLPSIYDHVETICLSVDAQRATWNGNTFDIDWLAFIQFVEEIDKAGKIFILEETFFDKGRTPIANECYQRQRMAEFLGAADWYMQIDTDEIIINMSYFTSLLQKHLKSGRPVNIHGLWINLIKQTETGFVYSVLSTPPLATNVPQYDYGRTNGHFNIYSNTFLAHITWARTEEEVYYKLKNWGHSHEFNGLSFFKIWQALDDHNWVYIKDFHPLNKGGVPRLYFQHAASVEDLVKRFHESKHRLSTTQLLNNNIWISRVRKLLKGR